METTATEPARGSSTGRVGLGLAAWAIAPGRAVAGTGVRAVAAGWRSPVLAPVRWPLGIVLHAAEQRGARAEQELLPRAQQRLDAAIDAAVRWVLAAELPERVATQLLEAQTVDRMLASDAFERRVVAVLDEPALERLVGYVLASRFATSATDRLLASAELRRVISHVVGSDELRGALRSQSEGLANDMADEVRERAASADEGLEGAVRRVLRRPPRDDPETELGRDATES